VCLEFGEEDEKLPASLPLQQTTSFDWPVELICLCQEPRIAWRSNFILQGAGNAEGKRKRRRLSSHFCHGLPWVAMGGHGLHADRHGGTLVLLARFRPYCCRDCKNSEAAVTIVDRD